MRCGVAAFAFAGALVLAGPTVAQTAQGQFTPDAAAPIQLHMPVHLHMPAKPKAQKRHKAKPAAQTAEATPAPSEATPSRPATTNTSFAPSRSERHKAVEEVLAAPAKASSSSDAVGDMSAPEAAIPFSFDGAAPPPVESGRPARGSSTAAQKSRPTQQPVAAKAKPASGPRAHSDLAALTPPPKETPAPERPKGDPHAGLTKQSEILFDSASTDPQADGADALKSSADTLNAALDKGAANVEIEAYGGPPGDKSSEARRLSLRRALAVRQLLIDGGVPANRIVVKAMGGADDGGNTQRVDVYLRGAS